MRIAIELQEVLGAKEQAVLVGVKLPQISDWEVKESLGELGQLVVTAGGEVIHQIVQERDKPHMRTFVGPGKAEQITRLAEELKADLVIFDHELTPSQQHNLEDTMACKVLDRPALILDIFAQRAHSSEGKLQVELAQNVYRLPRLRGKGVELSRLGGGIGTRGPGETKLEVDRRRIRAQIRQLEKKLSDVRQNRGTQRRKRKKTCVYSISLVGYTNTGKSTLLNRLTNSHVFVEDKLFATLDSVTRRLELSGHQPVVVSDTVGFIRRLPHELIAAFRSTLDEVGEADLLLQVIDAGYPSIEEHNQAVEKVLGEIGAAEKPRIQVFNKIDLLKKGELEGLKKRFSEGVFVSAQDSIGLEGLLHKIEQELSSKLVRVRLEIPFDKGKVVDQIYETAKVIDKEHSPRGTIIVADMLKSDLYKVEKYAVKQETSDKQQEAKENS